MLNATAHRLPLYRVHNGTFYNHVANGPPFEDCYKDEVHVTRGGQDLQVKCYTNGRGTCRGNRFEYGRYGTEGVQVEAMNGWDGLRLRVQAGGGLLVGNADSTLTINLPLAGIDLPDTLPMEESVHSVCVQRRRHDNTAMLTVNGTTTYRIGDGKMEPEVPRGKVATALLGLEWHHYDREFIFGVKNFADVRDLTAPTAI